MSNEIPSSKKREAAYNDHHVMFAARENVVHVSGNGDELVVYTDRGDDSVLVSVFSFGLGQPIMFDGEAIMVSQANIFVNPETAPMLFKAFNPAYFDLNGSNLPNDDYDNGSVQEEPEAVGCEIGSEVSMTSYYVEALGGVTVEVRGFDPYGTNAKGNGGVVLDVLYAKEERAAMIRESLVKYYGSEVIGL